MFLNPTKRFYSQVKKIKSTYESLELTTAVRLPTVIYHTPKLYDVIYRLRSTVNNDPILDQSTMW